MCKAKIFLDKVAVFNFSNFHRCFSIFSKLYSPFQLQVLIIFSALMWHLLNWKFDRIRLEQFKYKYLVSFILKLVFFLHSIFDRVAFQRSSEF